jgi:hypothetical protein
VVKAVYRALQVGVQNRCVFLSPPGAKPGLFNLVYIRLVFSLTYFLCFIRSILSGPLSGGGVPLHLVHPLLEAALRQQVPEEPAGLRGQYGPSEQCNYLYMYIFNIYVYLYLSVCIYRSPLLYNVYLTPFFYTIMCI